MASGITFGRSWENCKFINQVNHGFSSQTDKDNSLHFNSQQPHIYQKPVFNIITYDQVQIASEMSLKDALKNCFASSFSFVISHAICMNCETICHMIQKMAQGQNGS